MAFPPSFLDEIRARVPLHDVVGRRVKLTRRGREYVGLCPFHNEKTPSFAVVEEKGFYHCFGCGAHGDAIGFLMRSAGLSFPEAVETLAREAGLEVPKASPEEVVRAKQAQTLHAANEAAAAWFSEQLGRAEGHAGADYLRRRGLDEETIARFRLGFAPDGRDGLKRALTAKGFAEPLLVEAGLLIRPEDGDRPSYDRFRGRVMFPIADRRGRIVAFGGRVLGDEKPKYLNSPETPLFHKGRTLYAIALARQAAQDGQELLVAEGYMDVIALHRAGFGGAVAPLGTALTESQIEEMWRYRPEPILCFDGDEAGRRAAARAAERVLAILKPGHSLRFVFLPQGRDPDDLLKEAGPEAMRDLIAQARPLADWLWELEFRGRTLDTPERRAALRQALMERAHTIAERSVQQLYIAEFDARLAKLFAGPARGARPPWRKDRPDWRRGAPPAPNLGVQSDGNVDRLALRARQALLAAPILHPGIVDDIAEELAALDLSGAGELDSLRQAILHDQTRGLDSAALRNHLTRNGFSALLGRVLSRDVLDLHRFAAHTDPEEVKSGWRALADALARRPALTREVAAAGQTLAEDISPRNWNRLSEVKRQAAALTGAGEDEAVGKPARGDA